MTTRTRRKRTAPFKPEAENRTQERYTQAMDRYERAERRLKRAFTAWDKARDVLRRYDRIADKAFAANRIGGEYDPRELAK